MVWINFLLFIPKWPIRRRHLKAFKMAHPTRQKSTCQDTDSSCFPSFGSSRLRRNGGGSNLDKASARILCLGNFRGVFCDLLVCLGRVVFGVGSLGCSASAGHAELLVVLYLCLGFIVLLTPPKMHGGVMGQYQ